MKLRTHVLFSFSSVLLLYAYLMARGLLARDVFLLSLAPFTAALIQYVIDAGHTKKVYRNRVYYARSPVTHGIASSALVGTLVAAVIYTMYFSAAGVHGTGPVLENALLTGVTAAWSHLLLDAVTEGGVFCMGRRLRPPFRIRYDSPLNLVADLASIFMLYYAARILLSAGMLPHPLL